MKALLPAVVILSSLLLFDSHASDRRCVCIDEICLNAEVADTREKRSQGLMFRKRLAPDEGMLFIFEEEEKHSFWMKNMNFSLDIIWIGRDKRIVDIKTGLEPCRRHCQGYASVRKAVYVLEVNSGFVDRHQVKIGQQVIF